MTSPYPLAGGVTNTLTAAPELAYTPGIALAASQSGDPYSTGQIASLGTHFGASSQLLGEWASNQAAYDTGPSVSLDPSQPVQAPVPTQQHSNGILHSIFGFAGHAVHDINSGLLKIPGMRSAEGELGQGLNMLAGPMREAQHLYRYVRAVYDQHGFTAGLAATLLAAGGGVFGALSGGLPGAILGAEGGVEASRLLYNDTYDKTKTTYTDANGHPVSFGRDVANLFGMDPTKGAGQLLSGGLDGAFDIAFDPLTKFGKFAEFNKMGAEGVLAKQSKLYRNTIGQITNPLLQTADQTRLMQKTLFAVTKGKAGNVTGRFVDGSAAVATPAEQLAVEASTGKKWEDLSAKDRLDGLMKFHGGARDLSDNPDQITKAFLGNQGFRRWSEQVAGMDAGQIATRFQNTPFGDAVIAHALGAAKTGPEVADTVRNLATAGMYSVAQDGLPKTSITRTVGARASDKVYALKSSTNTDAAPVYVRRPSVASRLTGGKVGFGGTQYVDANTGETVMAAPGTQVRNLGRVLNQFQSYRPFELDPRTLHTSGTEFDPMNSNASNTVAAVLRFSQNRQVVSHVMNSYTKAVAEGDTGTAVQIYKNGLRDMFRASGIPDDSPTLNALMRSADSYIDGTGGEGTYLLNEKGDNLGRFTYMDDRGNVKTVNSGLLQNQYGKLALPDFNALRAIVRSQSNSRLVRGGAKMDTWLADHYTNTIFKPLALLRFGFGVKIAAAELVPGVIKYGMVNTFGSKLAATGTRLNPDAAYSYYKDVDKVLGAQDAATRLEHGLKARANGGPVSRVMLDHVAGQLLPHIDSLDHNYRPLIEGLNSGAISEREWAASPNLRAIRDHLNAAQKPTNIAGGIDVTEHGTLTAAQVPMGRRSMIVNGKQVKLTPVADLGDPKNGAFNMTVHNEDGEQVGRASIDFAKDKQGQPVVVTGPQEVNDAEQGKGYGKALNQAIDQIAHEHGYGVLRADVINHKLGDDLLKHGYREVPHPLAGEPRWKAPPRQFVKDFTPEDHVPEGWDGRIHDHDFNLINDTAKNMRMTLDPREYPHVVAQVSKTLYDATKRGVGRAALVGAHALVDDDYIRTAVALSLAHGGHILPPALSAGEHGVYTDSNPSEMLRTNMQHKGGQYPRKLQQTDQFRTYSVDDEHHPIAWAAALREQAKDPLTRVLADHYATHLDAGASEAEAQQHALQAGHDFFTSEDGQKAYSHMAHAKNMDPDEYVSRVFQGMRGTTVGANGVLNHNLVQALAAGKTPNANVLLGYSHDTRPLVVKGRALQPPTPSARYQDLVNSGFKRMVDPIVNSLSREPLYVAAVTREMKFLKPQLDQGLLQYDDAMRLAETNAVQHVLPLIHNTLLRNQFSDLFRNVMPFYFAQEQAFRRFGKVALSNPSAFGKYQLMNHMQRSSGIIKEDANGNQYVTLPGVGALSTGLLAGAAAVGLPVATGLPGQFSGDMASLSTVLPEVQAPGMSPIMAVALNEMRAKFPELDQPLSKLQEVAGGPGGKASLSETPLQALVPNSTLKALGAAAFGQNWPGGFTTEASYNLMAASRKANELRSQAQAATQAGNTKLASRLYQEADYYLPSENASDIVKQQAIRRWKNATRIGFLVKAITASFNPLATNYQAGDAGLRDDFRKLIQAHGGDFQGATQQFLAKNPFAMADTISLSAAKGTSLDTPDRQVGAWLDQNANFVKQNPFAAAYLLPHGDGQYDAAAQQAEEKLGLRVKKNLSSDSSRESVLASIYYALDSPAYYEQLNNLEQAKTLYAGSPAVTQQAESAFNAFQQRFFSDHPVFQTIEQSNAAPVVAQQTILQIGNALQNGTLPASNQGQVITSLYQGWLAYYQQYSQAKLAGDTRVASQIDKQWREQLTAQAPYGSENSPGYRFIHSVLLKLPKPVADPSDPQEVIV